MRLLQPDDRHRARLRSAGGLHGGTWLAVFPMTMWTTARARHYQLALALRLGHPLPELLGARGEAPLCGAPGCGAAHDAFGFHPGTCRTGNRYGLWTLRHDAFQLMLVHVIRLLGSAAQSCSVASGNWFGSAGYLADSDSYRRADVVCPHYFGPGRHLFLDTAVTDPGTGAALSARPSSAASSGVAAEQRAAKKVAKYGPLAAAVSSQFRAAVIERFGAVCDHLVGFISMLTGPGERDPLRWDDYCFSSSSRSTYAASLCVFSVVIADACLVDRVIESDVCCAHAGRYVAPRRARGAAASVPVQQRDIEGIGGQFWYEAARP